MQSRILVLATLTLSNAASATVYTVGPGAGYTSIHAALDIARGAAGTHEVHVHKGLYSENLSVPEMTASKVTLSGGWNDSFATRDTDPNSTTIHGTASGSVIDARHSTGSLAIEGFSLTGGKAVAGGGIYFDPHDPNAASQLLVRSCRIVQNAAETSGAADGGGVYAILSGAVHLSIEDTVVSANQCLSTTASSSGGGLMILAEQSSSFALSRCRILDNVIDAALSQRTGCGLHALIYGAATGTVLDCRIEGNHSVKYDAFVTAGAGAALWIANGSTGTLTCRRNVFLTNGDSQGPFTTEQVQLLAFGGSSVFSDSVVAAGEDTGIGVWVKKPGLVRMTNVTLADQHGAVFDFIPDTGSIELYNCILSPLFGLPVGVTGSNNLVEVDPLFVNPAAHDYRTKPNSPARNIGTNSPPGGLGPLDVTGGARIREGKVDAGAYESEPVSASSATAAWAWVSGAVLLGLVLLRRRVFA